MKALDSILSTVSGRKGEREGGKERKNYVMIKMVSFTKKIITTLNMCVYNQFQNVARKNEKK